MRYRRGDGPDDSGDDSAEFASPQDILRQGAESDLAAVADAPFPVYAPAHPPLSAPALLEWGRSNGRLVRVVLCHGDPFAEQGPLLLALTGAEDSSAEASYPLEDLIEEERERLLAHAGVADPATSGVAVSEGTLVVPVDGVPVEGALRREGRLFVVRLRPPGSGLVLTVTGRGVEPDGLTLDAVADLAPYARGRQELLSALLLRRQRREKRVGASATPAAPPEGLGLGAHRQLVDFHVNEALRVEAALRAHRRVGAGRIGEHRELWENAVRQQMRLAGEDREEADEAVTALVNQMISLAAATDWFPDSPEGRAAVEESIRFTAFDSEVASAPAQRAWLRQWHRLDNPRPTGPGSPEEMRLHLELTQAERAGWLHLWRTWHSAR